jgi:glycine/D-amino acid oxidase-like deaminating enzyme
MGPPVDSVVPAENLPSTTAIVVIGGGIIGTSAALSLAARGIAVVLCEKGPIGGEQSSRNWGWCRQAGRDQREMPLICQSLALWRDMNRVTEFETGFRACGCLFVGETAADERSYEAWLTMAKCYEIGARLVRGAELAALMPGATRTFRCGLHVATDGCAEPQRKESTALKARWNAQSMLELCTPRRWRLDRVSPFEERRVLDPAPNARLNRFTDGSPIVLGPEL